MTLVESGDVARRVAEVVARLRATAPPVELVAVTKAFPVDAVAAAATAGCTRIGENYADEVLEKSPAARTRGLRVHFIGRLQSNKVRKMADLVDVWESVDRVALVNEIAKRQPEGEILIQVNATGESDKGGCAPGEVEALIGAANAASLRVDGLMTVGPTSGDASGTAAAFRAVRRLTDDLDLPTCSMGMSHDLQIALDEGTTRVRLGTALFGARPRPS
ncbi:YggS family pyridoxal phosphate-dependent enzyme [soil metagenome]